MMRWCFLSTCKSGATNPEVSSTHRLPSQEPYRSLWLCALNLQHLDLGEESLNNIRICAQHFAPEDFMICKSLLRNRNGTSRTVILNPRAVPSLLLEPHDGRDLQDRRADALTRSEELANVSTTTLHMLDFSLSGFQIIQQCRSPLLRTAYKIFESFALFFVAVFHSSCRALVLCSA